MIIFRVDGNPTIGSGHVMRCLSIADAAKDEGIECRFVAADEHFTQTIQNRGFACDVLHTDYRCMEKEQVVLFLPLRQYHPTAIVVDSYFVTANYLAWLSQFADVAYLDDLAAFAYPVKTLVNYNIYGPELGYEQLYQAAGVPVPRLLLGPQYAPLRKQFQNLPPREPPQEVKNIFVSTGGADPEHMALRIARQLESWLPAPQYQFHFVVGAMNPDIGALRGIAANRPWLQLHENVQDIAGLMCRCDLAISAAGSTLYELCACGVPTITYAFADNQLLGMSAFERHGIMQSTGDIRLQKKPEQILLNHVTELAYNLQTRQNMVSNMRTLVDGKGVHRIAREMFLQIAKSTEKI